MNFWNGKRNHCANARLGPLFFVGSLLSVACSLPPAPAIANLAGTIVSSGSKGYLVGGTVTIIGLQGTVDLGMNGEVISFPSAGAYPLTYSSQLADGSSYTITASQRATFAAQASKQTWVTQTCTVLGGSGTISGADAHPAVSVTCTNNAYVFDPVMHRTWMRCSEGQSYVSGINNCAGAGSTLQYCSANDNSCNDLAGPGGETGAVTGHLDGSGASSAYSACDLYNSPPTYGLTTWRVPRKDELKDLVYCDLGPAGILPDITNCNVGYTAPTIDAQLFPDTITSANYWTSSAAGGSAIAWYMMFGAGGMGGGYTGSINKTTSQSLRCVADGP